MKEYQYQIGKYAFQTPTQIEQIKKEIEAIEYMKSNTELENATNAYKIYRRLNEKPSFQTIVGIEFMQELYRTVIDAGLVTEEQMPAIKVELGNPFQIKEKRLKEEKEINTIAEKKYQKLKQRFHNLSLVTAILFIVIGVMFYIAKTSDYSFISDYEKNIIDKYSSWEEELKEREQEILRKENQYIE